jgi:hypothetical protein
MYSSKAGVILSTSLKGKWNAKRKYTNAPFTSDECDRIIPVRRGHELKIEYSKSTQVCIDPYDFYTIVDEPLDLLYLPPDPPTPPPSPSTPPPDPPTAPPDAPYSPPPIYPPDPPPFSPPTPTLALTTPILAPADSPPGDLDGPCTLDFLTYDPTTGVLVPGRDGNLVAEIGEMERIGRDTYMTGTIDPFACRVAKHRYLHCLDVGTPSTLSGLLSPMLFNTFADIDPASFAMPGAI